MGLAMEIISLCQPTSHKEEIVDTVRVGPQGSPLSLLVGVKVAF